MSLNAGNAGALIRSAPAFLLYAVYSRRAVKACLTRMFIPRHLSRVSVACIGATPLSYDKGAFPAMVREFHRPPPFMFTPGYGLDMRAFTACQMW